jgi:hypothetical protein
MKYDNEKEHIDRCSRTYAWRSRLILRNEHRRYTKDSFLLLQGLRIMLR